MISIRNLTFPSACREYFDIVVLGEESARPKPHPDPYQDALKALGLQPHEAIICEDSPSGAVAALTGAVSNGFPGGLPKSTASQDTFLGRVWTLLQL